MSSRIRPYLNIKAGITALFRTTARYLHDLVKKESLFEKPYLDQDYRAMHLKLPYPDWPSGNPPGGGDGLPQRPKTWTFVWDPGICTLGVVNPQCGEDFSLGVSIGLLPPGELDTTIVWEATSSNSGCIEILNIENGISGKINCRAKDSCEDTTVSICVIGKLVGRVRERLTVKVPPAFLKGGVLDYRVAAGLPALVDVKWGSGSKYDCGCIDVYLNCCGTSDIAWDTNNSSETIAQGSYAVAVITDSLDGSPYTWEVSGTGFWVDAAHSKTTITTTSKTITIYADGSACGSCLITATACDGGVANGQIRCTTGEWTTTLYLNALGNYVPSGYTGGLCCDGSCGGSSCTGTLTGTINPVNRAVRGPSGGGTNHCDEIGDDCTDLSAITGEFTNTGVETNIYAMSVLLLTPGSVPGVYGCIDKCPYYLQEWVCS